ncbi:MAG: efflux RND transporter periplasmic adaptor subunit [Pseudomonadota bacterium]
MKKRVILLIFIVLFVGVGLLVYFGQRRTQRSELYYSGTIEATQAHLSFQVGGRVLHVAVNEGQSVVKGQLLAELDQSEHQSRYEQAKANLDTSSKGQEQLETVLAVYKKTLPAEVARSEAAVRALKSQLNELLVGNRAQDIERARQAFLSAKAVMEDARKNKEKYNNLYQEGVVSEKDWDAAKLKHEIASREYEASKESYDLAKEGARKEAIQTAKARLSEGEAIVKQARSNLMKIEATKKDIEAARSQVEAAGAALKQTEIQMHYTQLKAPSSGIITSRNVEPGEVVTPGREVLTLSDLARVDLKIFVDETEIGKVKPSQTVEIKVDTFPDKVYTGYVSFISPEGEFTPKIIQTRKERVKLVYLVKVSIPNPHLELKSGMPADAWLR